MKKDWLPHKYWAFEPWPKYWRAGRRLGTAAGSPIKIMIWQLGPLLRYVWSRGP